MYNPCVVWHVTWRWFTYWAIRLLAVHAKSFLNIYVWLQMVTQKHVIGNTVHSANGITMHFIVNKEQITYLKTLFTWWKFTIHTTYVCTHSHAYIRKSAYMHIHACTQNMHSISLDWSSPSKLSTHNPCVQGWQKITNVVCSAKH